MPQMIEPLPMSPEPTPGRKRWTRQECDLLRDNGLLTERYELIDGEIISKMGQKPSHASTIQFVIT